MYLLGTRLTIQYSLLHTMWVEIWDLKRFLPLYKACANIEKQSEIKFHDVDNVWNLNEINSKYAVYFLLFRPKLL